ncbi:MAG: hypothetical protein Q4G47_08260 [Lachnospiraceae bacterium]|nr:hypothetical protein [Lachnospiraceae bacterium]
MEKLLGNKQRLQEEKELLTQIIKSSVEDVDKEQTILLKMMVDRQERDFRIQRIIAFSEVTLLIVMIVISVVAVPRIFQTTKKVESTMETVNTLLDQAKDSLTQITELADVADRVMKDNEKSLQVAIENFNRVDFESLNRSISSLGDVMQPMVDFLSLFNGK